MNIKTSKVFGLVGAALALECSAVTLSVDKVQQRYPWNGLVDITYTMKYGETESELDALNNRLVFTVTDKSVDPAVVYQAKRFDDGIEPPLTAGTHHIVWKANEDGIKGNFAVADLKLAIRLYAEKYLVIDVSAGPSAEHFPVTYMDAPPATPDGFNCDEYKGHKIVLRQLPPGSFRMGSAPGDYGSVQAQEAARRVTLTRPFYIGIFEVTQAQYTNIMNVVNNSEHQGQFLPMDKVSYNTLRGSSLGVQWPTHNLVDNGSFFSVLRAKTGLDFDLPTEAQWEYACRAGSTNVIPTAVACTTAQDYRDQCALVARCGLTNKDGRGGEVYNGGPTVVGSYLPNAWGLYDMLGNLEERCIDWRMSTLAPCPQNVDPVGCADKSQGVNRGGDFSNGLPRAAMRNAQDWPGEGRGWRGFRVALTR